jgi:hypothetical protein
MDFVHSDLETMGHRVRPKRPHPVAGILHGLQRPTPDHGVLSPAGVGKIGAGHADNFRGL